MDSQTVATTLSDANQTAVPSSIRQLLSLKSGDRLIWQADSKNNQVIIKPLPKKLGNYMRGLGQEIWKNTDVAAYIKDLRRDRS